ncbi:hypothetical protein FA15DRAFT_247507 [Coprinopsis marcescibilis]|uniref:DUF6533 domain-containing protein n=1 Tax=Coprinopsis marcescibilis TaxID=230819 RepID=A0A5C3L2R5_COPMA|nr:hypothetical protein FA15DRAFT_247507 [Coprinopsis marcescibilis]
MQIVLGTILLVDYIQTLSVEINYIWRSKWSLVKALFLMTRYSAFISPIFFSLFITVQDPPLTPQTCHVFFSLSCLMTVVSIFFAEAIFFIRVYAIAGRQRIALIYLILQFVVIHGTQVAIVVALLRTTEFTIPPEYSIYTGCFASSTSLREKSTDNLLISMIFVLYVISGVILLIITSWISLRRFRGGSRGSFQSMVFRDGLLYFVSLATIAVINIVAVYILEIDPSNLSSRNLKV